MTEFQIITEIKNAKTLLEILRKNNVKISNQIYSDKFEVNVYSEDLECIKNSTIDVNIKELQKSKVFYDKN